MNKNILYRSIPKVDLLLEDKRIQEMMGQYGRNAVMECIHIETDRLRKFIAECEDEEEAERHIRHRNDSAYESGTRAHWQSAYGEGRGACMRIF